MAPKLTTFAANLPEDIIVIKITLESKSNIYQIKKHNIITTQMQELKTWRTSEIAKLPVPPKTSKLYYNIIEGFYSRTKQISNKLGTSSAACISFAECWRHGAVQDEGH